MEIQQILYHGADNEGTKLICVVQVCHPRSTPEPRSGWLPGRPSLGKAEMRLGTTKQRRPRSEKVDLAGHTRFDWASRTDREARKLIWTGDRLLSVGCERALRRFLAGLGRLLFTCCSRQGGTVWIALGYSLRGKELAMISIAARPRMVHSGKRGGPFRLNVCVLWRLEARGCLGR